MGVIQQLKERMMHPLKLIKYAVFQATTICGVILTVKMDSLTQNLYPKT